MLQIFTKLTSQNMEFRHKPRYNVNDSLGKLPAWIRYDGLVRHDKIYYCSDEVKMKLLNIMRTVPQGFISVKHNKSMSSSATYTFARWEPFKSKIKQPLHFINKLHEKIGLAAYTELDCGKIKDLKLEYAINYSYYTDLRFNIFLCIFFGYCFWSYIAPEPLLNHPLAWSSPNLNVIINAIQDTYVNNVCCSHPDVVSPCICGEPINKTVMDLIPEQTFDPLNTNYVKKKYFFFNGSINNNLTNSFGIRSSSWCISSNMTLISGKLNMKNNLMPGNMHVMYRSYSDESSHNRTKVDMISMESMLDEMDFYYEYLEAVCIFHDNNFHYCEEDIEEMKSLLKSGYFQFSPLYAVSESYILTNNKDTNTISNLYIEKADDYILSVLRRILVKGLYKWYLESCYSKYNENVDDWSFNSYTEDGYNNFTKAISDWTNLDTIIKIDCRRCIKYSSRSRIIEKLHPILDFYLLKLISSYYELYVVDEKGYRICEKPSADNILHNYHEALRDELINILLDDVDQLFENQLKHKEYARYYDTIIIGIKNGNNIHLLLRKILLNINLHYITFIHRDGNSDILGNNREIKINKDGVCEIEKLDWNKKNGINIKRYIPW